MNAKTNKVTLVPASKKGNGNKATLTASTATIKSPLDTFKASGIGERMRKQYGATFYADPVTQTGDAVSTLSDEYLMKVYDDIRAANPGANDERMWTENGDGNGIGLLVAAMAQAESDSQNQETSASNITASNIRSSAHKAATVLSHDETYSAIQGAIIDAERTRKQAPAQLAWTLERLYVRKDADGKVLCNMIDGTGPEFDNGTNYPWPVIGTKEKDSNGNVVNNPDIMMKYPNGSNKAVPVSFYGEVIRDTPAGRSLVAEKEQYLLAAAKVPTGKYADQSSPDYCDAMTAEKKADECSNDIDTMVKSLKRAVTLLRQIWAVNEMAPSGQPSRCVATFRTEKKWNTATKSWDDDPTKLARMDSPIVVHDKVSNETATFRVGEFLSHDPVVAGKAGGTLADFRKAVSKVKRASGSGTGQTAEGQKAARTVLSNSDLERYIAAIATSVETPAAWANWQQSLNQKPEDSDAKLQSTWRIMQGVLSMFATQPDLRKRVATLEKLALNTVDDIVGIGREDETKKKVA
jgi:hypothetical protein